MRKPRRLSPSSRVRIVAPASPVRDEFLSAGIAEIERLRLQPQLGRSVHARSRYTAGEAEGRLSDFLEAWNDPNVDAVFCARGGYGAAHLLRRLDPERLQAQPKILLGSSDITVLLLYLARLGLVGFHGPMVAQQIARGEGSYDSVSLLETLMDPSAPRRVGQIPCATLHKGRAEGVLLGGCLSLLASLVGTPFLPSFGDAILFLEDTGVKPYQVDRLWTQMVLAGLVDGVRAVVFGEMPGCEQAEGQGYRIEDVLSELTAGLGVPVLFGFPSGHTTRPALTLPFGVRARVEEGRLSILEGAVL